MMAKQLNKESMQIKLSKAQWEAAGQKAGWLKKADRELPGGGGVACKNCGKRVTNDKRECPSCGTKNPNYWKAYGE